MSDPTHKTKPELSKRSKYWIEKHRYYELKHFCLQYPIWRDAYSSLHGLSMSPTNLVYFSKNSNYSDPTFRCAEAKLFYRDRTEMLEKVAKETSEDLYSYILQGITEGVSYDYLKARLNIPCCREVYYELYRKFFWLLNGVRE